MYKQSRTHLYALGALGALPMLATALLMLFGQAVPIPLVPLGVLLQLAVCVLLATSLMKQRSRERSVARRNRSRNGRGRKGRSSAKPAGSPRTSRWTREERLSAATMVLTALGLLVNVALLWLGSDGSMPAETRTGQAPVPEEAFQAAVAGLQSDSEPTRALAVRQLGRIGALDSTRSTMVVQTLADFVRDRAPYRPESAQEYPEPLSEAHPDVFAAVEMLTRPGYLPHEQLIDLRSADLRKLELPAGRDFSMIDLSGTHMDAHSMVQGADFRGAVLEATDLGRIDATRAMFQGVHAHGAYFLDAHLEGSCLHGTDLRDTEYLGTAHLTGAYADQETQWPDGFDPAGAGVRLEACPSS